MDIPNNDQTIQDNKIGAKKRILDAAAEIFAEKSYDGARVDEIAKAAGVPKSLIYYHFKSKEEILKVLTQEFLDQYAKIVDTYRDDSTRESLSSLSQRMKDVYYQFGKEHENLVRTILMDSVKQGNTNTALFEMMHNLLPAQSSNSIKDKEHLENEFFFNVLPCIAFICFRDSWIQYFQMEPDNFDHTFLETYAQTHLEYHKNYIKDR